MLYEFHIAPDLRVDNILLNHNKIVDKEFGLFKTTMTKRMSDSSTVNWKEETLPDKKAVRDSLEANDGKAPRDAHLSRKFSLTYNLRKRLRIGI